jgi:hypothetical protein
MKKKFLLSLSFVLLSACSHENPLLIENERSSAHFLVNVDDLAEKKLKPDHHVGMDYVFCHEGKIVDENYCKKLYKEMGELAKSYQDPAFHRVTASDISDPAVYRRLSEHYKEFQFNMIPEQ